MYHVHTLHIHVHAVYIRVHRLYMGTTDYLRIQLPCMPVCTALVICMYYAIVQEYDFLYVLNSDRYIPPKNSQDIRCAQGSTNVSSCAARVGPGAPDAPAH
jgi:hypothetical protein